MRKRRVLVFDDEPIVLNMLNVMFTEMGYEVLSYRTPKVCPIYEDNTKCCVYNDPCADIVITDYDMPGMNGLQLIEEQCQRSCKIDIKNKAIISGFPGVGRIDRMKKLGCTFMPKPFEISEFLKWIDECEKIINLSKPLANL